MGNVVKLSKEKILIGIVSPFVTALAFALSFLENKDLVSEILDETSKQINDLKDAVETPPTMDEAIQAAFDIAETVADTTPTEVDDTVVATAKSLFGGGGLVAAIKGLINLGKAHKADKKNAAAAESSAQAEAPAE